MSDINIGNPGVCKHGQLHRQCDLCEKDERIADLETTNKDLAQLAAMYRGRAESLERQLKEAQRRLDWIVANQGKGNSFNMSKPCVSIRFPVLVRNEQFWSEPTGVELLAAIDRASDEGKVEGAWVNQLGEVKDA